jgi:heme-degrading monooxygenase HmoA
MLLERTELLIKPGQEDEFAEQFGRRGIQLLTPVPGVVSAIVGRGVENPNKFLLLIEWANLDAHRAYNQTPVCNEVRALIAPFAQGASMEHFAMSDFPQSATSNRAQ